MSITRFSERPGDTETYKIAQVDPDHPEDELQNVVVSEEQPSGHFYIGDTEIWVEYVEK